MKEAISRAVGREELPPALVEQAFEAILGGTATPAQVAALLVALHMKGETVGEIAAAARVMRRHSVPVPLSPRPVLLDTCGTGGDGSHSFNISTAAAIVVAACGVAVAKHGNRAASSQTGSADVLEALGVKIELSPAGVAACIDSQGIGFMFARAHHPAMRHAAPVRAEIGVRTLFNVLGPLCNPAGASHQLIGVPRGPLVDDLARVLALLGCARAWVVHGHGGLDEVSISGPTAVACVEGGALAHRTLHPEDFGVTARPADELRGGDAKRNAGLIRAVLAGDRGPRRDAVVVNAAAALCVAGVTDALSSAAQRVRLAIDSGDAARKLDAWVACSQAQS